MKKASKKKNNIRLFLIILPYEIVNQQPRKPTFQKKEQGRQFKNQQVSLPGVFISRISKGLPGTLSSGLRGVCIFIKSYRRERETGREIFKSFGQSIEFMRQRPHGMPHISRTLNTPSGI